MLIARGHGELSLLDRDLLFLEQNVRLLDCDLLFRERHAGTDKGFEKGSKLLLFCVLSSQFQDSYFPTRLFCSDSKPLGLLVPRAWFHRDAARSIIFWHEPPLDRDIVLGWCRALCRCNRSLLVNRTTLLLYLSPASVIVGSRNPRACCIGSDQIAANLPALLFITPLL